MKVICPECSAEFDVPVSLLGTGGRRVRCSSCGHVWMADVTDDTGFGSFRGFDENMDIEPIPSSVHPEDDDGVGHAHDGEGLFSGLNKDYLLKLFGGFALACALAGILLGIGMAFGLNSGALRPLYAPFGLAVSPPPTLVIESSSAQMGADTAGQPALQVTGTVRNAGDDTQAVPEIEVTILEGDKDGDTARAKADKESLEGGEATTFTVTIPTDADPKGQVRLRFIP